MVTLNSMLPFFGRREVVLYAATRPNLATPTFRLYQVDPSNGAVTLLGGSDITISGASGIGLASISPVLYAIGSSLEGGSRYVRLYTVNVANGSLTLVGSRQSVIAGTASGVGLGVLRGTLYAVVSSTNGNTYLSSVSVSDATLTAIGGEQAVSAASNSGPGLAGLGGVLYMATVPAENRMQLYSLNVTTGAATAIGNQQTVDVEAASGVGLAAISGGLYAATVAQADRMQLYSVDTSNGSVSAIGGLQTVSAAAGAGIGLGVL